MAKFDNPLNNVKIASPCSQDWNAMIGNDRTRYCGECKLNVFNLSGMSRAEAENLVMNAEGRLCVRFYKRADGSVITEDCPVGWARIKQRTKVYATALASLIFSFFGALGLVGAFNKTRETTLMGDIAVSTPRPKTTPKETPKETPPLMGAIAPVKPEKQEIMGKMAIPEKEVKVVKVEKRKN